MGSQWNNSRQDAHAEKKKAEKWSGAREGILCLPHIVSISGVSNRGRENWEQVSFIGAVAHDETEILGEGELRDRKLGIRFYRVL